MATKTTGETAPKRKRAPRKQAAPVEATVKAEVKRVSRMSDGHKAALAAGREEGRAVRTYLEVRCPMSTPSWPVPTPGSGSF
jgi:hypothetical protein